MKLIRTSLEMLEYYMHSISLCYGQILWTLKIPSDTVCAYKDMQLSWLSLMLVVMNKIYPITNSFQSFMYLSNSPEASYTIFY